ncbi:LysR family transcriptional regulator, partial [Xanthomonas hortorum]|uniref:LysR family transcriptional regulator n=1 Tax=Xanthomonas hortorum TaxID=56454 RepID=UPI002AA2AF79
MIDLNDIALYVQVVRSGSFAEAARRLGTAPNSVSRRVQQLEAQLDTRLMQRSTRKLTLTDAGQAFFERCADAVDGLTSAGQSLVARRMGGRISRRASARAPGIRAQRWQGRPDRRAHRCGFSWRCDDGPGLCRPP